MAGVRLVFVTKSLDRCVFNNYLMSERGGERGSDYVTRKVGMFSCSLLLRRSQALPRVRHFPVSWSRQGSRLGRTYSQ